MSDPGRIPLPIGFIAESAIAAMSASRSKAQTSKTSSRPQVACKRLYRTLAKLEFKKHNSQESLRFTPSRG